MSKTLCTGLPCPFLGCGSSDAYVLYEDGGHCFSCGRSKKTLDKREKESSLNLSSTLRDPKDITFSSSSYRVLKHDSGTSLSSLSAFSKGTTIVSNPKDTLQYINYRGIPAEVRQKYKAKALVSEDGIPLEMQYPYGEETLKIRFLKEKGFTTRNPSNSCIFGKEVFSQASAKAITITEGEEDAMSVFYMMGSKYPCVSVRSSGSARKDCEREFKYLNSFEQIYLCFDSDGPGVAACKEVAELFDTNKIRIVKLSEGLKDANDYLTQSKKDEFVKCWWNAKQYLPEGIVNTYDEIEKILKGEEKPSLASYPFPTLQDMTYGLRSKEVVLFTAQEGIGKTEIIRAIEYHILKTTDYNIGIIHLEEGDKRSVQGLVSYELGEACHLPDTSASVDIQLEAFRKLSRKDSRVHLYSHFGTDNPDGILDVIRYLVSTCGCKFIFLDHITMMVTGMEGNDDERRKLDYLSTRLAMMVHQYDFSLILISHINDDGKTRGSRNISKVCHLQVQLDRDKLAETFDARHTTTMTVLKNRFAYKTGNGGYLLFDPKSFIIKERSVETPQPISPF